MAGELQLDVGHLESCQLDTGKRLNDENSLSSELDCGYYQLNLLKNDLFMIF